MRRADLFAAREQARREAALLKEKAKAEAAARQSAATKKKLVGVGSVADTKHLLAELKRRVLEKKGS